MADERLLLSPSPSPIRLPTFSDVAASQPTSKHRTPGRALTREEKMEASKSPLYIGIVRWTISAKDGEAIKGWFLHA